MLANRLVQKVMSEIPDVIMNGDPEQRYPGKHIYVCLAVFMRTFISIRHFLTLAYT